MKPTALLERIGQAIASVGKKPDEQLSLDDIKVIVLVITEAVWEAKFDICPHAKVISGFCMDCAHAVEQKEAVK